MQGLAAHRSHTWLHQQALTPHTAAPAAAAAASTAAASAHVACQHVCKACSRVSSGCSLHTATGAAAGSTTALAASGGQDVLLQWHSATVDAHTTAAAASSSSNGSSSHSSNTSSTRLNGLHVMPSSSEASSSSCHSNTGSSNHTIQLPGLQDQGCISHHSQLQHPAASCQAGIQQGLLHHSSAAVSAPAHPAEGTAAVWHAQHTAAVAEWRLLTEQGQDETSALILACSSVQQLLALAHYLIKRPGTKSKWHFARLAAMAAVLTRPEQPAAAQLQQQQQQLGALLVRDAFGVADACSSSRSRSSSSTGSSNGSSHAAASFKQWTGPHDMPRLTELTEQQQLQQQLQMHLQQLQPQATLSAQQQLAAHVLQAVGLPCIGTGLPALHVLRGARLSEVLHAVHLLHTRLLNQQQRQHMHQQLLLPVLQDIPQQALLTAVHGCSNTKQLASVVAVMQQWFTPVHLRAAFVQLARLQPQPCSSTALQLLQQQLLVLLPQQLPALQPHQCASILWSLGQLGALLPSSRSNGSSSSHGSSSHGSSSSNNSSTLAAITRELLVRALSGLGALPPRVTAQLLHGAARLQLQLPGSCVQDLMQHTQQQLGQCGPQGMSCVLWSLAQLQQQPSQAWLEGFYHSSWTCLQQQQEQLCSSSGSSNSSGSNSSSCSDDGAGRDSESNGSKSSGAGGNSTSSDDGLWQQQQDHPRCFAPKELAALLSAASRLQLQPPGSWLAAVADAAREQLHSFEHQELGVMLWGFVRLGYLPPLTLLAAAADRVQLLGPAAFAPQSLVLVVYGFTRLTQWHLLRHKQQQQQQQQHQQQPDGTGTSSSSSSSLASSASSRCLQWTALQLQQQAEQFTATELALLAWTTAMQQLQQQKAGTTRQQPPPDATWHAAVLQPATSRLQQGQFTTQGLSMLVWGLGTTMAAAAAAAGAGGCQQAVNGGGGREPVSTSRSRLASEQPLCREQQQQHDTLLARLAAFWAAAQPRIEQQLDGFSGHELANFLWGAGAMAVACGRLAGATPPCAAAAVVTSSGFAQATTAGSPASPVIARPALFAAATPAAPAAAGAGVVGVRCTELMACQAADMVTQLTNYQAGTALQGLVWLKHPMGLDLLQAVLLSVGSQGARLASMQPQELLILLRACIAYRPVLDPVARRTLAAAVGRVHQQLQPTELAQMLYLLGKLQMQQTRHCRRAAAAAAAAATAAGASSSGRALPLTLQQQQVQPLVPAKLLKELLARMAQQLQQCGTRDVSLMLWGVSHLSLSVPARAGVSQQQQELQQQQEHAALEASSSAEPPAAAATVGSRAAGMQSLLQAVYAYTQWQQQLASFQPGNLATLLYALHRLRASPSPGWLAAVECQLGAEQLQAMDGQSLAVLALAASGLSWGPAPSWLQAFVHAAAAAERRGALNTRWQRSCIANSLAALDPLAAVQCSWL